jgi:chondroitin AC lyase
MFRILFLLLPALVSWSMETAPSADLQSVRRNLIQLLSPGAEETVKLTEAARAAVAGQAADGTWPSVDYADTQRSAWRASQHLTRQAWSLAVRLHATQGADAAAAESLRRALDAWSRLDLRNSNWWHNEIGVPMALGGILLLAGDAVDAERRAKACTLMRRSKHERWTGQNLVWGVNNQIMRGCLEGDEQAVADGFTRFYQEIRINPPPSEGVQPDYSFHQHGNVIYSGGYGQGFTCDGARLLAAANGTRFQAPAQVAAVISSYLLDGQRWMIRGGYWDFGVVGREFCRPGKTARGLAAAARLMAGIDPARSDEFTAMAAAIAGGKPDSSVEGNRHFWCSDYMSHQRPAFFASVRMHSKRIDNTDSLTNGENERSHFIADGATCLMRDGTEYVDIYPVWDWQRVPGITCEQRPAMPEPKTVRRTGATTFVGGVSDGSVGLAAMQHRRDSLSARKTWLLLDDAVVCLGAGITCTSGLAVATSINQCLLRGPAVRAPGDGLWAWHDHIGYALLAPGHLSLSAGPQRGRWSDIGVGKADDVTVPVFSLAIDHGRDPVEAAYAYVALPGITSEAMPAWLAAPPIRVLSNTTTVQAAEHRAAGVLGVAFHQPGRLDAGTALSVDQPCLVLLRRKGSVLNISVANPENRPLSVQLEVDEALSGDDVEPTPRGSRIRFALPGGADAGRSVARNFTLLR